MVAGGVSHPRRVGVGAVCWLAAPLVLVAAHLTAQVAWSAPFSWARNNISNLGHVSCVWFAQRYVCSPWHAVMNVGFISTGLLIIAGTVFTLSTWAHSWTARTAAVLIAGAGLGYVLVGVAPADVNVVVHLGGALMIYMFGNVGLLLAAGPIIGGGPARVLTMAAGCMASAATLAHLSGHYFGLGPGGTERIAFAGLLVLLLVGGIRLLRRRTRRER